MDIWQSKLLEFTLNTMSAIIAGLVVYYLSKSKENNGSPLNVLYLIYHYEVIEKYITPDEPPTQTPKKESAISSLISNASPGELFFVGLLFLIICIVLYANLRDDIIYWGWRIGLGGIAFTLTILLLHWKQYRSINPQTLLMLFSWGILFLLLYVHQYPSVDSSYYSYIETVKQERAAGISLAGVHSKITVSQIFGLFFLALYFYSLMLQTLFLFIGLIVLPRPRLRWILYKLPYPFKRGVYLTQFFSVLFSYYALSGQLGIHLDKLPELMNNNFNYLLNHL
ncbi:hypothetical protein [Desulforamulus aquiferis]|uniref:Uncharacterized protein n=1 Tax=Desulforamulus aquiferis TaxID=1397668 RepID=A0AAW7Z9R9_9FIRM|nr:hypothetical protein [Desulforamulus aquiferis]MDO7785826.1 hypothetical protein [Desulforamulus aquiferis]